VVQGEARLAREHGADDVAKIFDDIAHRSRPELPKGQRLVEMRQAELKDLLLHGSDAGAIAAVYELVRRIEGKALRWTQLQAVQAMVRGEIVNMAAGEGKSLVFLAYAARKATQSGVVAVQLITTRDNLANREVERYRPLLEPFGFDVVRMNPEGTLPPLVDGKPTILIGTHEDVGFSHLRGHPVPGRHAAVDEID
jgi:preprotein translocase subunit SecA